jgi:hypothetical protein
MRKISLIILLINISIYGQARKSYEDYMKKVYNNTQNPNAWKFSDYSKEGNVEVSTGKFGMNIPFTTIENQFLTLPISLSYSTSGVKVDENSSEIGMGWNLIAGGQITRKVNGGADDLNIGPKFANLFVKCSPSNLGSPYTDWRGPYSPLSNKGRSNGSTLRIVNEGPVGEYPFQAFPAYNEFYSKYFPLPRKGIVSNPPTLVSDYKMMSIMDIKNNIGGVENQRDVFHVSVGEINFNFILKVKDEILNQVNLIQNHGRIPENLIAETDYVAVPLDDNDIKIDIIRGHYINYYHRWDGNQRLDKSEPMNFFTGFIITDKNGIKYYFNNYVFTEPQFIVTLSDHSSYAQNNHRTYQGVMQDIQVNTWVLSKILFPNDEIVQFDYIKNRITEPKIVPRTHDGEYTGFKYNLNPQITPDSYNNIDFEYEKLYIDKITSHNKTVKFNYDS